MWNDRHADRGFFRALINLYWDGNLLFYTASWFLIRFSRKLDLIIPFFNNWLTDFVFVPLIAHFCLIAGNILIGKWYTFKFPLYQLLLLAMLTAFIFEYWAPQYTTYNTYDPFDILAYIAGACYFYAFHQPLILKKLYYAKAENKRIFP